MAEPDVTGLLEAVGRGETEAYDRLIGAIQTRLHEMAAHQMRHERGDHTLRPTALVNEAYIRLVGDDPEWANRKHFFGAAAEAMRRVLIDHARKRAAAKRGGGVHPVTLHELNIRSEEPDLDLLGLHEALDALEELDVRLSRVVRLRYFAGFGIEEVAEILGISPATVKRDWTYARAWLLERMRQEDPSGDP